MTEPKHIRLLGSRSRIVLDDGNRINRPYFFPYMSDESSLGYRKDTERVFIYVITYLLDELQRHFLRLPG